MDEFSKQEISEEVFLSNMADYDIMFSSETGNQFNLDEHDSEEDYRELLPCPYCTQLYEIYFLCSHIESEHCFDSKPAVCLICNSKVSDDMIGHIHSQHSNLFKNRRFRIHESLESLALVFGKDVRDSDILSPSLYNDDCNNNKSLKESSFSSFPRAHSSHFFSTRPTCSSSNIKGIPRINSDNKKISFSDSIKYVSKSQLPEVVKDGASTVNNDIMDPSQPCRNDENVHRKLKSSFVQELVLSTIFDNL